MKAYIQSSLIKELKIIALQDHTLGTLLYKQIHNCLEKHFRVEELHRRRELVLASTNITVEVRDSWIKEIDAELKILDKELI